MRTTIECVPLKGEEWHAIDDVAGYERYAVSSFGRVRFEYAPGKYRVVKTHIFGKYHCVVIISNGNQKRTISLPTLVARYFIGERPADAKITHNDFDITNNRADNLHYATPEEYGDYLRHIHRVLHGHTLAVQRQEEADQRRQQRAQRNVLYQEVVKRWNAGEIKLREAAELLGVSQSMVSRRRTDLKTKGIL